MSTLAVFKIMMKARKASSKKSTDLPADFSKMVREVIETQFKAQAKDKRVVVEGKIFLEEVCLRVGFQSTVGINQVNFEASVDHSPQKKDVMTHLNRALDALGSLISEYFSAEGDIEVPKEWHPFEFEGAPVYLKVSSDNSDLEQAADRFLAEAGALESDKPEKAKSPRHRRK
ncbi:MAG: hypothetical protein IT289_05790 [Oligoflexia bacterium]|nr:hypothetical protein [Oligoflexia bacterium]